MKRKVVTALALTLAFAMVGCGNNENGTDTQNEQTETEMVVETEVVEDKEPEITVVETTEFSDDYTNATKTVYSNDIADYEVWAEIPYWNANIHYKIKNMPTYGVAYGLEFVSFIDFIDDEAGDALRIKVWAYENIENSQINLKNMSDNQLGTLDGKNPDLTKIEKNEDGNNYTVGVPFEIQDFGTTCMAYNYYVNDYENDKAYYITVNAIGKYANYEFLYNLAHSVEVLELN